MSLVKVAICCLSLSVLILHTSFAWNIQNDTRLGLNRYRRQAECDGFKCTRSGECIDEDKYCDGKVDCIDGSDETDRCKRLGCQSNLFRCRYGACISLKLECDGKTDCRDGSDEGSQKCANRRNMNTKCKPTEFQCKSEQCISEDRKCDGKPDCTDKSDETEETCAKFPCPGFTFKCKYGACVSKRDLCNGVDDCHDGSDEDPAICNDRNGVPNNRPPVTPVTPVITITPSTGGNRPPIINTPGSCVLPPQIQYGRWSVWSSDSYNYQPGDRVMDQTFLEVNCSRGYDVTTGNGVIFCRRGAWSEGIPQCGRVCPLLHSSAVTNVTCLRNQKTVDCNKPFEGTFAHYMCAPFYELTTTYHVIYCSDGTWSESEPACKPVCGQKTAIIKELIIGGEKVKRGDYPWVIAIYRGKSGSFSLICGGSLISERLIVTAAHCVSKDGRPYPKENYRVAAGKYYRDYDDEKDTDAEFSEVEEFVIPTYYKGSNSHYEADIAVIVSKERFKPTDYIQRICMDYDQVSYFANSLSGLNGTVTGWGYTAKGNNLSNELKEIQLPFVDHTLCYNGMPDKYKKYVIRDKICAGYLDKGIGVCEGDSGGGLAFKNPLDRDRFYLRGVVSTSPQVDGSCDEYKYALYTKVSDYLDFIRVPDSKYS